MGIQPLPDNLQGILEILRRHSEGLSLSQIMEELPGLVARRTLQRRLALLIEQDELKAEGARNQRVYVIPQLANPLSLSSKANKLKMNIRRPLVQRTPVGFKFEFLYDYIPNETYYLSSVIRNKLKSFGQQFDHPIVAGTYAKKILHRLLIDLSWNSSRLEGNTYSLLETEHLLLFGAEASGKDAFEAQMILNHKEAIEFIVEQLDETLFDPYFVMNIHALLSNNLLANPAARGALRKIPVAIGKTVYHLPEIPQVIEEYFHHLLGTASKINDPFEQAFFMLVQLPYLQPFEDVNKRVSRLCANMSLLHANVAPLSFVDVPVDDYESGLLGVYELNNVSLLREVFVWAYERSANQYQLLRDTLQSPNLIYMRYHSQLKQLVRLIIEKNIHGAAIIKTVADWSVEYIEQADQTQFSHLVEKEIASLHKGNIAVYSIEPTLFAKWRNK